MSLRGRQRPPKLERLESVMSRFSGSLDQDDLQDDPEELDSSVHTDLCDGKLLLQCVFASVGDLMTADLSAYCFHYVRRRVSCTILNLTFWSSILYNAIETWFLHS